MSSKASHMDEKVIHYICWRCGHENEIDSVACESCSAVNPTTVAVDETPSRNMNIFRKQLQDQIDENAKLNADSHIILHIKKKQVTVALQKRTLMGRDLHDEDEVAVIDLGEYGAHEAGVSRYHAELRLDGYNQLTITDIGSSNGTYVNGKRLLPLAPRVVVDRDSIYLGNLRFQIEFDSL